MNKDLQTSAGGHLELFYVVAAMRNDRNNSAVVNDSTQI